MKISFIGGGNMARALISGLLDQGFKTADIEVIETDADKRQQLQADFAIGVTGQLPSVANADVIVLAVKPQQLRDLSIFLGTRLLGLVLCLPLLMPGGVIVPSMLIGLSSSLPATFNHQCQLP